MENTPTNMSISLYNFETAQGGKKCLRIRANRREDRQPIHFTMLLDTSGSMEEENRLQNVKWSLKHILKYLTADDQVSLVEFNNISHILFKTVQANPDNKILLEHTIQQIRADGSTNLSSVLVSARECLVRGGSASASASNPAANFSAPQMKQGIVLLTDGHANQGVTNPAGISQILERLIADSCGASLACIGYGITHNADLLRNLATEGGGSYNVVQNLEDIAAVFADILGGLISCSAQQVEIIIDGNYTAESLNTHYAVHVDGSTTKIILGDLHSENEVVLILPNEVSRLAVKGFDLQSLNSFEYTAQSSDTYEATTEEKQLARVNFFRIETTRLIENIRKDISGRTTSQTETTLHEHLGRTQTLRVHLEALKHEHALYELLLEELLEVDMAITAIMDRLNSDNWGEAQQIASEASQVLAQHATFLSIGRGVRSHFTPATPSLRQLTRQVSGNPQLHSTFSNTLQRQISEDMVSQIDEDPHARLPQSLPHLRTPGRILRNLPPPPPIPEGLDPEDDGSVISVYQGNMMPGFMHLSPITALSQGSEE